MPVYRNRTVLEVARGIKAFFDLEAGLTRGKAPTIERNERRAKRNDRAQQNARRIVQADGGVQGGRVNTENMIWILGSPRTGSTWLSRILGQLKKHLVWNEPFFGVLLGLRDNMANSGRLNNKDFLLADPYKDVWLRSMRRLFLDVCEAKFPGIKPNHYLVVKEPNGSFSAPLIMEAFPESKLIFLTRDGRDVVASLLDAAGSSWYGYDRYEPSLAEATMQGGRFILPRHESEEEFVEQLARNYVTSIDAVEEAYARHPDGAKAMIGYEELREDPFRCIRGIYETLRIGIDENRLKEAIAKRAWENIPEGEKGEGKFFRKAKPGSWKEDLTERQIEIVERVIAGRVDTRDRKMEGPVRADDRAE